MLTKKERELQSYYDAKPKYYSPAELSVLNQIAELAKAPQAGHMLDVGCGDGRAYRYAAQFGMSYTGIDYSQQRVRAAREKHLRIDIEGPTVAFICADLYESLPNINCNAAAGAGCYDFAWCCEVLEHMTQPAKIWKEMLRLSELVVCTVPVNMPHEAHLQVWKTEAELKSTFQHITSIDTIACRTPGGRSRQHFVMIHDRRGVMSNGISGS